MLRFAMAHLDIERNAAVRAFVEKRLAEHYKGNRSASASSPRFTAECRGGRSARESPSSTPARTGENPVPVRFFAKVNLHR